MSELQERDAMICRNCGNEERASEGYPCKDCGTFVCVICAFRGVARCSTCAAAAAAAEAATATAASQTPIMMNWPEH